MIREEEQILLGTWLRGEHLEDMALINEEEFVEREIFSMIKSGCDLLEISKKTHRISELAQWTEVRSDTLYKQELLTKIEQQTWHEISNMKDLNKIKEYIEAMQGIKQDTVEECKNPALKFVNELDKRAKEKTLSWIKVPTLQRMTGGIKRGELTALAARPSVGKSAFGLQISLGVAEQKQKVLYFPLEMTAVQTYSRMVVHKGYLSTEEVKTGKYQDKGMYSLSVDFINDLYKTGMFKVYEGCNQLENIEKLIIQEKPYLVLIDQLSQLKANRRFNSFREQFSYMTSTLKALAIQHSVAIVLLCQINRGADNQEPTMANLKESGSIEEDSDNVILLHNLSADDLNNPETVDWTKERPMLLNLSKQRDGEIGKFIMYFKPSRFSFYEKDFRNGRTDNKNEIY